MAASKNDFSIKKKIMKKKLKDLHSFEPGQYLLTKTNKGIGSWQIYATTLMHQISMCNQMVTSEIKAREIIRIWTKRK